MSVLRSDTGLRQAEIIMALSLATDLGIEDVVVRVLDVVSRPAG